MNSRKKIVKLKDLKRHVAQGRRQKKKITFTNGCFDILHFGHVTYLEAAKKNDRILIIGLNSDSSTRKLKGPGRPVNPQLFRARVIASLSCVDYVTIFNQETPYQLIRAVKPDILIKGADWKGKEVVGSDIVRKNGGRVELIRYIPKLSTTNIIRSIKKSA